MKKKFYSRILSVILVLGLVLGDQSVLNVLATENYLLEDYTQSQEQVNEISATEEVENKETDEVNAVDEASVSDSDVITQEVMDEPEEEESEESEILRAPEKFYEEPEPENYGTLVSFDEDSRTYYVEDNKYVTVIGFDGNRFVNEEGELERIDNTLVDISNTQGLNPMSEDEHNDSSDSFCDDDSSYVNTSNSFVVNIEGDIEEGEELYTIENEDSIISIEPLGGDFHKGITDDNAIRYSNVYENVDFQYTLIGNTIKEDIILLDRQDINTFKFKINTNGLKAETIDNALFLYEAGKDPLTESAFILEAPEMEDAAGEIYFGVRLEAVEENGAVIVTVTADKEWLDSEERVYPVRIDPTAIQVTGSKVHIACVEQGSPNTVIGDNQYPYVGYDDGVRSGNLKGFGSRHLNCRSYFQIDYDFSQLADEPEIVSASFYVTQKTKWSKGNTRFELYRVDHDWKVNSLTWNSQPDFDHYFLDGKAASAQAGDPLCFDVTKAISGYINGTSENFGFVMKADKEPGESAVNSGLVESQCEVFYNNASAIYGPKLVISWTGELTDLENLTVDDTTIDVYPVVARNGDKCSNTLGVAAHGLAKPNSVVYISVLNGSTGQTVAKTSLVYPDSSEYEAAFPSALPYKRRLSNWQSNVFSNLIPGQVYFIEAYAKDGETGEVGKTVRSDSFLIYKEGAFDLIPRIANHYGVDINVIMSDMDMQDCLTKAGNLIFIRNPKVTSPYVAGELSDYYKALIDGLLLGRAQYCEFGFEPVNLNTGNFYMEQSDVELEDIGGTFSISRFYNSKASGYLGSLGYGWSFAYDERLGELEDGSVIFLSNNGGIVTFSKQGTDYVSPVGSSFSLTETEEGYKVYDKDTNEIHSFNAFGLLSEITDIYGNSTKLIYDYEYNLKQITTPSGKTFVVTLDENNRIKMITQPDGKSISYDYDANSNLISVTDQAGYVKKYEYDSKHQMTAWYDENGAKVVANIYDGEGRVTKQTDAEGGVVTFGYGNGTTITTDACGNVTTYHYDSQFRTTKIDYPDGYSESRTYTADGYLQKVTARSGVVTTYSYDNEGRLVKEERQDGSHRDYAYNNKNQIAMVTDFDGSTTTYTYDAKERLVSIKNAEGGITKYEYDDNNRLIKETDPLGNVTSYTYTGACPDTMTDANGNKWLYTYDAMNRLSSFTDPKGNVSKNSYDEKGRLIKETDALGNTTGTAFDKAGAVTAITDKEGKTSTFTYDKLNRMLKGTDPLGNTITYTYDKNGNKLTETNALNETFQYTYDSMGRILSVTDNAGETTAFTYDANGNCVSVTDKTEFNYNVAGDLVLTKDNLSRETTYKYDVMHRLLSVTDAEGGITSYTYDERGNAESLTNALGYTYTYSYDKADQMITVLDPEHKATSIVYDKVGNVTSLTLPGERVTTYEYDGNYNTVGLTDPMGYTYSYSYDKDDRLTKATNPLNESSTYVYDVLNRVTSYTNRRGNKTSLAYDKAGNVVSYTDELGLTNTYTYDLKNRLTSVRNAVGSEAFYGYDVMDNLVSVTDYMGKGVTYTYDEMGNLTSITDAAGRKETMEYDIAGRIKSYTSNGGNKITYDYDKIDSLVEKSYEDSEGNKSAEPVRYAYDALAERVAMYDNTGDTKYTYDALGRIASVTTNRTDLRDDASKADTVSYIYDDSDELSSIVYPDGSAVTYDYDKNGNLIKVTDREDKATTYVYDAINRITEIHRPNGISTYNTYDEDDHIIELVNKCDECEWVVSKYSYTYNEKGYIVSEKAVESLAGYAYDDKHSGKHTDGKHDDLYPHGSKHNGKHTKDADFEYQIVETDRTFTYDDAGKLIASTENEENQGNYSYVYEYDLCGNRTRVEKSLNGKVVEWHEFDYNESNQLVSEKLYDGKKTTNLTYTYDEDGNRISESGKIGTTKVDKTYSYTVENRLEAVHDGKELLMAVSYDGDGNRVFQLNYNLHTDGDLKGNSGNGNGNNKDNKGSGNNGKGSDKNGKGNSKSSGTDDTGYGNATNAEEHNSQNQCGILFPVADETSSTEEYLISLIKTSGKEKNYELIEYINDVNREYVEVLVEQNINGKTDSSYIYGAAIGTGFDRLSLDRFDGSSGYYLYDPNGNVTGITNEIGQVYQSYRYDAFGQITFGAPQYENEYTYNGESYNPNIQSQYLRARYYNVISAVFITEDTYLGDINEPLTLNRYNYCISNPVNFDDPSGNNPGALLGAGIGALGGFVIGVIDEVVNWNDENHSKSIGDVTVRILNSTITGAVGGAVLGGTGNMMLAGAAAGATYGFIDSVHTSVKEGDSLGQAVKRIGRETAVSTISGTISGTVAGGIYSTIGSMGYIAKNTIQDALFKVANSAFTGMSASVAARCTSDSLQGKETAPDEIDKAMFEGFVDGFALGVVGVGSEHISNSMEQAKAKRQVNTCKTSYGKSSGESNNLEEILNIMKEGEKTSNGKNIISQLDEKTKVIFRMDIGENAHSIRSKGYLEPINHINIEIQRLGQNGKYSPKWDYHIILDDMGNIIDTFTLGVWTK